MEQIKLLTLLIHCVWTAEGLIWNTNTISNVSCAGNNISLGWSYTSESGEILSLTEWTKSDGAGGFINVADDFGGFTPAAGYGGRLIRIGNAGIQISNATSSDGGMYRVLLTLALGQQYSVNNSVEVHVAPTSGCSVSVSQSSNTVTCTLNTGSGNFCGTPALNAYWVNFTTTSNQFECTVGGTYQCCATSAALTCYSGSPNDFCTLFNCTRKSCELELGIGLGLSLGIQFSITCIVVIFVCTGYTYAYKLGLLLGLGLGITFLVSWIIIVSLMSSGNPWKLELVLGLVLGSVIPCVIAFSVAVIFMCKEPEEKPPELKDQKIRTKKAGPPAVHTGTQNKAEPKTSSKQINDRHRPLPPLKTAVEDSPKFRQQPPPPQNSDIKDRNQRGISATTDDTPGLPNETPRPIKLAPFPQKQTIVEEEDASEEPKKKRKKKKKERSDE